ncbi:glycosyl hydrolase-related protein [Arthrobacter psychrolactophilus]
MVGAEVQDAVAAGYAMNLPWRGVPAGGAAVEPLISTDSQAALIESVKLADDRSGDVMVRLYEPLGARAQVTLSASFPVASVAENNLLEQPYDAGSLTVTATDDGGAGSIKLALRPFQILTLRLKRADA